MGYGQSKESASQERKNLLNINPIPDHASGSFMSKHSSSNSAFHQQGNVKSQKENTQKNDRDKYRRDPNYNEMSTLGKLQHDVLGPKLGGKANWKLRRVGMGNWGKS